MVNATPDTPVDVGEVLAAFCTDLPRRREGDFCIDVASLDA